MFYKKSVLKNVAKFIGKHLCQSHFFKVFIKEETQVFSCEFCEIFKNTFFTEHLWTTAFVIVFLLSVNQQIYASFVVSVNFNIPTFKTKLFSF